MVCAIGCYKVGYRAGQTAAEKEYLQAQELLNEKMDQIWHNSTMLSRDELLDRLHGHRPE